MSAEWRVRLALFGGSIGVLAIIFFAPHPLKIPAAVAVSCLAVYGITRS